MSELNEKEARRLAGLLAEQHGFGGVTLLALVTGLSRVTVLKGKRELKQSDEMGQRIRKPGAGRKRKDEVDPTLYRDFVALMEEETGGLPSGSSAKWPRRSTRKIAEQLSTRGRNVSHSTIGRWLRKAGYSMRSNRKRLAAVNPHRDEQFRNIRRARARFMAHGEPVISVDAKKRELVGNFKNAGREWRRNPRDVNTYDFPSKASGVGIPYGIYDVAHDEGFVVVGTTRNTPEFSTHAIRSWWRSRGRQQYPNATQLLILADSGGSNGSRATAWKSELKSFADDTGLVVRVAHYPSGASKWNPIEHRLFSFISINWAAQPLKNYSTMLKLIRGTTTSSGLHCRAKMDWRDWRAGKRTTCAKDAVRFQRSLPVWNYSIYPSSPRRNSANHF